MTRAVTSNGHAFPLFNMRQIDKILTFLQANSIPVKKAVSWNRSFDAVESKMSNVVSSVMVFGATGETGKGVVKNLLQRLN